METMRIEVVATLGYKNNEGLYLCVQPFAGLRVSGS